MNNNFDIANKTPTTLALMALGVIGDLADMEKVETWTLVAMGHFDDLLPFAFFQIANNRFAETVEEVQQCPKCKEAAERVKDQARFKINFILNRANEAEARQQRIDKKKHDQKVLDTFKSQHKPAPEGTVKELAEKYQKSIGEIRRLKNAGLLHTLNE